MQTIILYKFGGYDLTFNEAKKALLYRFSEYGATEEIIVSLLRSGIEEYDFSVEGAYNALRMELSINLVPDREEYFSVEDIMSITGETYEECIKQVEEMREEILQQGGNPDDYAVEVKQNERKVFFFPDGI